MQIKMEIQIKFNRNVDKKKDYISAGGFEMIMNGKPIQFDFMTSYGKVSKTEADVCAFELEEPDNKSFPDFALITPDDIRKVSDIIECFVYTGEDEEHDLVVKEIIKISFYFPYEDEPIFEVPRKIIDKYNAGLKMERSGIKWMSTK